MSLFFRLPSEVLCFVSLFFRLLSEVLCFVSLFFRLPSEVSCFVCFFARRKIEVKRKIRSSAEPVKHIDTGWFIHSMYNESEVSCFVCFFARRKIEVKRKIRSSAEPVKHIDTGWFIHSMYNDTIFARCPSSPFVLLYHFRSNCLYSLGIFLPLSLEALLYWAYSIATFAE